MLKIDWALGFGNHPRIIVEDTLDLLPREECEFEFKDGMWWHIQDNGLVRYFAHGFNDENEGGFGGANITVMHKGEPFVLRGPWSSRASWLNTLLPEDKQIADIRLYGRGYPISIGILVSKLVDMWDQDAYLLRGVRSGPEQGPITASMAPDCILKPDGSRYDPDQKYKVYAEPVK
jgi:hypothetical protein